MALDALADLDGRAGRLELVGRKPNGAMVFVDYAHTPEALASVLQALRPMTDGRLVVVFGAGGDRDPGKRPLMGEAAADNADGVIVTDDNPRARIRRRSAARSSTARPAATRSATAARRSARRSRCSRRATCSASPARATRPGRSSAATMLPFSDHEAVDAALAAEEAA